MSSPPPPFHEESLPYGIATFSTIKRRGTPAWHRNLAVLGSWTRACSSSASPTRPSESGPSGKTHLNLHPVHITRCHLLACTDALTSRCGQGRRLENPFSFSLHAYLGLSDATHAHPPLDAHLCQLCSRPTSLLPVQAAQRASSTADAARRAYRCGTTSA